MSIDVAVAATIARPREDVARYAMDPGHEPRWISGIESSRRLTTPDGVMGMQVARVARFAGRRVNYILEVVGYEPDRRIVMRSVQSPFPMEVTYEFEDAPGGSTRARLRVRGGAGLMFRIAGPLMAAAVRRNLTRDLRTLKRILESTRQ